MAPSSDYQVLHSILVIDDDTGIHEDYQRSLIDPGPDDRELDFLAAELFGDDNAAPASPNFEILHAFQGQEGVEMLRDELAHGRRLSMAFVDIRMPPGWDGVETTRHLWELDPDLQIVLCTAYSDFTWEETVRRLGRSDGLHLLRKPFSPEQVRHFACTLSERAE